MVNQVRNRRQIEVYAKYLALAREETKTKSFLPKDRDKNMYKLIMCTPSATYYLLTSARSNSKQEATASLTLYLERRQNYPTNNPLTLSLREVEESTTDPRVLSPYEKKKKPYRQQLETSRKLTV